MGKWSHRIERWRVSGSLLEACHGRHRKVNLGMTVAAVLTQKIDTAPFQFMGLVPASAGDARNLAIVLPVTGKYPWRAEERNTNCVYRCKILSAIPFLAGQRPPPVGE
jgi:hypothetical protein